MKKLNSLELSVLDDFTEHRYVSETLEEAFYSGGLSEFRKFILAFNKGLTRKYEGLAVLLRGNDNKIIIYKDNHKIWELSAWKQSNNKVNCKVSFDFNHARYTKDWPEKYNRLYDLGFRLGVPRKAEVLPSDNRIKITRNKKEVIGGEIGMISCTRESFSDDFVKKSYEVIRELLEDYFKCQEIDYFRKAVASAVKYKDVDKIKGLGSSVLVEKRWQQRLLFYFQDILGAEAVVIRLLFPYILLLL